MGGYDSQQLRALAAIADAGSLDAAASALALTPSAVSQRLRALERACGQVLVVRSRPIALTAAGEAVLRLATQVALLEEETHRELAGEQAGAAARTPLAVAVNADSLATWFLPAVAPLADAIELRVQREDEGLTSELLRRGVVMAAVTTQAEPVAGCESTALGVMRYRPMAAPGFARRWFAGADADAFRHAPVVTFDAADQLQQRFLRRQTGADPRPPFHLVPASADYLRAIELGFGWGLVPEPQLAGRAADYDGLVALTPDHLDVALHWQRWSLRTASLRALTVAVLTAARSELRQP
ncbi:ArgP/LysG family DNA-binding transcriptional regulator [Conexibacter sp. JD483]|uniref:ArgP/LysG family DNA-binding transcriptional regulator n=1 Tax=unclassified Conexibacter TaxID=2627773 RepID=UPI0027241420|nr:MULTISPECIES: ArgP/LysG family DNA-binding transcriptional regulator [unclassified Conexibacter]MDO8185526.1 ArgP/LysG family DNA-binding transcriptional regulator [Conexibacter sp. CPCC 205706]MDO8197287.1 ArgP/LysG family DNA-binding transcriptional regulator [Conexibacter sp. CPCC 205762]MDR9370783.1 ArgP/LysG family DNA-binding transcriptional regulator [Conexibacter sp. JD483]